MKKNLVLSIIFFVTVNSLAPGMIAGRGCPVTFAGLEAYRPVLQRFFSLCMQPSVQVAALVSGQPLTGTGEKGSRSGEEDGAGTNAAGSPRLILQGEKRLSPSLSFSGRGGTGYGAGEGGAAAVPYGLILRLQESIPSAPLVAGMFLCIVFCCLLARGALPPAGSFSDVFAHSDPTLSRHGQMACRAFLF